MPEMLKQFLLLLLMLLITISNEMIFIKHCLTVKKSMIRIFLILSGKIFLINVIWNMGIGNIYKQQEWFHRIDLWVTVLGSFISLLLLLMELEEDLNKVLLVLMISDFVGLGCAVLPYAIVEKLTGLPMMDAYKREVDGWNLLIFAIGLGMLYLAHKVARHFYRKIKEYQPRPRWVWSIVSTTYLFVGIMSIFLEDYPVRTNYLISAVLVSCSYALLVYWINRVLREHKIQLENEYLLQQKYMLEEHYKALQDQIVHTRRLRHDMATHMQMVQTLWNRMQEGQDTAEYKRQVAIYLQALQEEFHKMYTVDYCENMIVDALICNEVKRCEREQIPVKINMQGFKSGNITDIDLLKLISNLFINAIEASEKIEKPEEREIQFQGSTMAGQIIIRICNRSLPVAMTNGKWMTTRREAGQGIGHSIIREVVEKYQGTMKSKYEEGIFEVIIIFL
ncbi:MAG: ATP-binding protein [Lachnospiraceae bacterium]|nr:ATP-binding protein [Lachnospiraceae bacterium]